MKNDIFFLKKKWLWPFLLYVLFIFALMPNFDDFAVRRRAQLAISPFPFRIKQQAMQCPREQTIKKSIKANFRNFSHKSSRRASQEIALLVWMNDGTPRL